MSNAGMRIGAGLTGYNQAKRWNDEDRDRDADHDWRINRRERDLRREKFLDPAEEETTGINLRKSRADEEDRDFRRPIDRRLLERADISSEMSLDDQRFAQPLNRIGRVREERTAAQAEKDADFARPFAEDRLRKQATIDDHNVNTAKRQDRYSEIQFSAEERMEQARNAVGILKMTGDPKAMEDWYNNLYEDDEDVTIERVGENEYVLTHSSGMPPKKATREEIIQGFEEHMMGEASMRFLGGGGMGGSIRGSSRGGRTSQSAANQNLDRKINDYIRSGMDPLEATMQAHEEASYKASKSPQEAANEFYKSMVEKLLPQDMAYMSPEEREEAIGQAEEQAERMTQRFESYLGGGRGSIRRGGGGDEGGGRINAEPLVRQRTDIPQGAIELLRQNPDMADQFDAKYGEGSAEAYLNGR